MTYSPPIYNNLNFNLWPAYQAPDYVDIDFIVGISDRNDVIGNLPAFQVNGITLYKEISVELPSFNVFLRDINENDINAENNVSIPRITSFLESSDSSQINTTLAKFTSLINTGSYTAVSLPSFVSSGTLLPGFIINANITFANFQSAITGKTGKIGNINITMPAFYSLIKDINGYTYGDIALNLPKFTSYGSLYNDLNGNIQVTMPKFNLKIICLCTTDYILEHINIITR